MEGKNCRTCLKYSKITECVSVNIKIVENKSILDLIESWASVKVAEPDKLPTVVCNICHLTIKSFADFILMIVKSDIEFKKKLFLKDINTITVKEKNESKLGSVIRNSNEEWLEDGIYNECKVDQNMGLNESKIKSKHTFDKLSNATHKSGCAINKCTKKRLQTSLQKLGKIGLAFHQCQKCNKKFKTFNQYKMHMTVHTGEKYYSCTICGKCFPRKYVLVYHMRIHTGEKKFICDVCNKSFIHPSNLYKHKKIHMNTRSYQCDFCTKSFIESEALKIHVRRIHTGNKPFLCELCSESFFSQSALWVHKQDRHKQKESCEICKKQFSSRSLKRHIERHQNTEENSKKCICEQCGKNFSSDHNLQKHLLSHKGLKPYASQPIPCLLCKKLYSKRRIKSHICVITTH